MARPDVAGLIPLLGLPVPYYPKLSKIFGIAESVFLCKLMWCTPRCKDAEGWVYKESAEMEEETGLSYDQQLRIRKKLKELGVIEERHHRLEHRLYFRICRDRINDLFADGHLENPNVGELGIDRIGGMGEAPVGEPEDPQVDKGTEVLTSKNTARDTGHPSSLPEQETPRGIGVEGLKDAARKRSDRKLRKLNRGRPMASKVPAMDDETARAYGYAREQYRSHIGREPSWTSFDQKCLTEFLTESGVTVEEFCRRWRHYMESTDEFVTKQHGALTWFCRGANFDRLADGPIGRPTIGQTGGPDEPYRTREADPDCKVCGGTGFKMVEVKGQRSAANCDCRKRKK